MEIKSITNTKEIRILFLAQYAPKNLKEKIPAGIIDPCYAKYHHRIYFWLKNFFNYVQSESDVDILFDQFQMEKIDYIFSLYNRIPFRNSEIFVSSLAEYYKKPYLGATPNIRALAEDKHLGKMLANSLGIKTPNWKIYDKGDKPVSPGFPGPYIIKPRFGATSNFITEQSICVDWQEAKQKLVELIPDNESVILEELIEGATYTMPVLSNFKNPVFLPSIRETSNLKYNIITKEHKRKIKSGLKRVVNENNIIEKKLMAASNIIFKNIQPLDYTRIDYMVSNKTQEIYFLEFNVCCNLGEQSSIIQSAQSKGILYDNLIGNILFSSMFRQGLISKINFKIDNF